MFKRNIHNTLRNSHAPVSVITQKAADIDAYLLYNGAPEEYEDAADYTRLSSLKGWVLA